MEECMYTVVIVKHYDSQPLKTKPVAAIPHNNPVGMGLQIFGRWAKKHDVNLEHEDYTYTYYIVRNEKV